MELKSDARVNCSGPQNRGARVIWPAVVLAALAAALPASTMSDTLTARATDLLQKLQFKINDLDHDVADGFKQRIATLRADASSLDQLEAQVEAEKEKVDPLEMDYKNAQSNADGLQQKFENDLEDAKARIRSIQQQEENICSQLGGGVQADGEGKRKCMFRLSCEAGHEGECQARLDAMRRSFDQQVSPLNSQLAAIPNQMETEQQQAEAAAQKAQTNQQAWEDEKSRLDDLNRQFNDKKSSFEQEANSFESDLDSAKTTHIQPKLGPAYGQAGAVNGQDNGKCFDTGCAPVITARSDGTLDVPAVQGVPAALAGNAGYKKLHEDIVNLTQQYNDASAKLTAAERNPQTKPDELQALVKEVSQFNSQLIIKQYQYKSYTINLAPTPALPK